LENNLNSGSNNKEDGQFNASSKFAGNVSDLDRDLVVLIENSDPHQPTVFMEKSDDDAMVAGMISLVPSFKLKDQKVELIFLVDRSGSMHGTLIEQAKKALELFLHSLPMDCFFNIFSFGSSFDSLFPESRKYDDDTLSLAKHHVSTMEADYGGTEIYQPLNFIFERPRQSGHLRQIFVLTDGEVSNGESVIQLVKRNGEHGRIFSLGLGSSASRHLVKGIARAGGGTAVFAMEGEDLRGKVLGQLKNALQPSISEVEVIWEGVDEKVGEVKEPEVEMQKTLLGYMKPKKVNSDDRKVLKLEGQAPIKIPPIYDGSRLLVYRLFSPTETEMPKSVTVKASTPDGPLSVELPIEKSSFLSGNFVHQLAARKRIQDLEELVIGDSGILEAEVQKAIVELGIRYKLASKHTSFVGVDEKSPTNRYELEMVTREVANQIPHGFQGFHGFQTKGLTAMPLQSHAYKKKSRSMMSNVFGFSSTPPPHPQGTSYFQQQWQQQQQLQSQKMSSVFPLSNNSKCSRSSRSFGSAQSLGFNRIAQQSAGSAALHSDNGQGNSSIMTKSGGYFPPPPPPPGSSVFGSSQTFGFGSSLGQSDSTDHGTGTFREENVMEDTIMDFQETDYEDELTGLIRLQAADGHFSWGDAISKCFGKSREEISNSRSGSGKESDETIWTTVLAVVALEMMTQHKDLWELVVQKARKFLAEHLDEEALEKIFAEAKRLYSTK